MFIFSKIPELMDTVFLVLQKKPVRSTRTPPHTAVHHDAQLTAHLAPQVIFLHWFHHVTVLLYCWHAYVAGTAPGLWFACINYCVHSIM
jgi:elongation of very long chain fatty acids protein 6